MKTLNYLLYSFCIFFLLSCNTKTEYSLDGVFTGDFENIYEGKMVHLTDSSGSNSRDSCLVVNNTFAFKENVGKAEEVSFIFFAREYEPVMFIKEPGKIQITIGNEGRKIAGTPLNDSYQNFSDSLQKQLKDSHKYSTKLKEMEDLENLSLLAYEEIDQDVNKYITELENFVINYINNNLDNPLAEWVFFQNTYFIRAKKLQDIPNKLKAVKDTPQFIYKNKIIEGATSTKVGQPFKDIKGINIAGDSISVSDYVGKSKILLLYFWVSSCDPCRVFSPVLKELQNKYKQDELIIIGVTLDDNKKGWIDATKVDEITWDQIATFNGEETLIYGITGIPELILIDKEGIIKDRRTFFNKIILENKIKQLLK